MHDTVVYIASCAPDGGLYGYGLSGDGQLELLGKYTADRPMYAIQCDDVLYVLLRAPFADDDNGGAVALRIHPDGNVSKIGGSQLLNGEVACHLALAPGGRYLYTANYQSGSVSQVPVRPDGGLGTPNCVVRHTGSSVHPTRQTGPHTHCTVFTPDGTHLCVVDLGLDKIALYAVDAVTGMAREAHSWCALEPGLGPRHLVFSRDGTLAFCANELKSSVTVLKYSAGRLEPMATYPTLPAEFTGDSFCAAIRVSPCGRHLYVSNRGHDSLACYAIEGETLRLLDIVGCGGLIPWDFDLTPRGGMLVCANQKSGTVTTFHVDQETGGLSPTGFRQALATPLGVTIQRTRSAIQGRFFRHAWSGPRSPVSSRREPGTAIRPR